MTAKVFGLTPEVPMPVQGLDGKAEILRRTVERIPVRRLTCSVTEGSLVFLHTGAL